MYQVTVWNAHDVDGDFSHIVCNGIVKAYDAFQLDVHFS